MAALARGQKAPRGLRRSGHDCATWRHFSARARRVQSLPIGAWRCGRGSPTVPMPPRRQPSPSPSRLSGARPASPAVARKSDKVSRPAPHRFVVSQPCSPKSSRRTCGPCALQGGKQSGNSSAAASPAMMRRGTSPAMGRSRKDLAADVDDHGACVPTQLALPVTCQHRHAPRRAARAHAQMSWSTRPSPPRSASASTSGCASAVTPKVPTPRTRAVVALAHACDAHGAHDRSAHQ